MGTERTTGWFVTASYGARQFGTFTVRCETREQAIEHIQRRMWFCWGIIEDPKCIWRWSAIRVTVLPTQVGRSAAAR